MTRSQDLATWLLENVTYQTQDGETLAIQQAVIEANLNVSELPCAVIEFKGVAPPDVLDGTQYYEQYTVALAADRTGGNGYTVAQQLAQLETSLINAALTAARFSSRWIHLKAAPVAAIRKAGVAMWQIDLLVTGN